MSGKGASKVAHMAEDMTLEDIDALDEDTCGKCIAYMVAHALVEIHLERTVNMSDSLKAASKSNNTSQMVTHNALADAHNALSRLTGTLMKALKAHPWYASHRKGMNIIESIPEGAKVRWIVEDAKEVLEVDGIPRMKCNAKNASIYKAYRIVHRPSASIMSTFLTDDLKYTKTLEQLEIHKERTLTTEVLLGHGSRLRDAIQVLANLL